MIASSGKTVFSATSAYLSSRPTLSRDTVIEYQGAAARAAKTLGTPLLGEVAERFAELPVLLLPGRSPSTVNKICRHLAAVLRFAASCGWTKSPPTWKPLPTCRRIPVVWTTEEVSRIWHTATRVPWRFFDVPERVVWPAILGLIWDTGCRIGEVLKAEKQHFDLRRSVWFVPAGNQKTRSRDRFYRLHPETVEQVQALFCWCRKRIIPMRKDPHSIYWRYKRLLEHAGLPSDKHHMFHCLRRTVATLAAAARGIQWAADAIGHGKKVAIESYVHPLAVARGQALCDVLPRPWRNKQLLLPFSG